MNNVGKIRFMMDKDKEIEGLKCLLSNLKSRFKQAITEIEDVEKRKMSGQYALFGVDEQGKYVCRAVCDPYKDNDVPDETMNGVLLVVPLPDHTTLKEWDGF